MIGLAASTVLNSPRAESAGSIGKATRISENSGRNFERGSRNWNRPCSQSCIKPTVVIGFVMDAIRKIVSLNIGALALTSRDPKLLW